MSRMLDALRGKSKKPEARGLRLNTPPETHDPEEEALLQRQRELEETLKRATDALDRAERGETESYVPRERRTSRENDLAREDDLRSRVLSSFDREEHRREETEKHRRRGTPRISRSVGLGVDSETIDLTEKSEKLEREIAELTEEAKDLEEEIKELREKNHKIRIEASGLGRIVARIKIEWNEGKIVELGKKSRRIEGKIERMSKKVKIKNRRDELKREREREIPQEENIERRLRKARTELRKIKWYKPIGLIKKITGQDKRLKDEIEDLKSGTLPKGEEGNPHHREDRFGPDDD